MRLPHLAPSTFCLHEVPTAVNLDLPPLAAVYRQWRYTGS